MLPWLKIFHNSNWSLQRADTVTVRCRINIRYRLSLRTPAPYNWSCVCFAGVICHPHISCDGAVLISLQPAWPSSVSVQGDSHHGNGNGWFIIEISNDWSISQLWTGGILMSRKHLWSFCLRGKKAFWRVSRDLIYPHRTIDFTWTGRCRPHRLGLHCSQPRHQHYFTLCSPDFSWALWLSS